MTMKRKKKQETLAGFEKRLQNVINKCFFIFEMELLLTKYGKQQSLCGLFNSLVEADDKACALVRGTAVLERARELSADMLESACQNLASSAAQVRAKYKLLYKEAEMQREKEEHLRERKTREVVALVLLKLESLSRRKRDPADEKGRSELIGLMEESSVLLVNPSIDPWLDLVDFCEDQFGKSLKKTLHFVFDELEVVPHSRKRAEDGSSAGHAGKEEAAFVLDKKKIKNELVSKTEASAVMQAEKKSAPQSLGSLRKSEKKVKASAVPAPPPQPVVVKKISVKKKKSPLKKQKK